jgi:predicted nucleotide-binding protein
VAQSVRIGKSYGEQSFNNEPLSRVRRSVLVIHGRDELNLLRLKELLQHRWNLGVVTFSDVPGRGETIIEKFERASMDAVGAIALLTRDDRVTFEGHEYYQARPGVFLELGWAFHRFGRRGVYIVCQQGITLPSDLDGINRVEFRENVLDVAQTLEAEFEAVGMLRSA